MSKIANISHGIFRYAVSKCDVPTGSRSRVYTLSRKGRAMLTTHKAGVRVPAIGPSVGGTCSTSSNHR